MLQFLSSEEVSKTRYGGRRLRKEEEEEEGECYSYGSVLEIVIDLLCVVVAAKR